MFAIWSISSVKDMNKIGVVKSSLSEYAASKLLAANDIEECPVQFAPVSPADISASPAGATSTAP
jgi:hypothetical protein